jgi:RecB family exonuclease
LGSEGSDALKAMQARGAHWLALADEMECPAARVPAAIRPSPRPPVSSRPRQLSVTRITELIRDPYAIYARHILRLRKLDPLSPEPDARVRGMALHQIMERFLDVRDSWRDDVMAARHRLSTIARETLAEAIPQPSMQALWHARLMAAADRLVDGEIARLAKGEPVLVEDWGRLILPDLDFRLVARPDRIDRLSAGGYAIYDYKSGNPPTKDMVKHFDKQLPLEAAMLENDAFTGLSGEVSALGYVAIGASGQDRMLDLEDTDGRLPEVTLEGLRELIGRYATRAQGYTAIRAAQTMRFSGDYDHLARYGEWDLTDDPVPLIVGPEGAT